MIDSPGTSFRYRVDFDAEANVRLAKATMQRNWPKWLLAFAKWGALLAVAGEVLYSAAFMTARLSGELSGYGFMGAAVLFVTAIWGFSWVNQQFTNARDPSFYGWDCEISDEWWSFTDSVGVKTSIPWRLVRIVGEDADAWIIPFRRTELLIYRAPLRRAGLEELFLERVHASAATESE